MAKPYLSSKPINMRTYIVLTALLLSIYSCGPADKKYDLLLTNCIIYDGVSPNVRQGMIGIKGDKIVEIGELQSTDAATTLDMAGMAVAPGFINMLSWANEALIEDGRSQSDIRQGVTLEVMGEGRSMGPLSEDMKQEMLEDQSNIKYSIEWTTLGEYLTYLEDKGVSTNITSFVGNGTLRRHVIGYDNRPATEEEIAQMQELAAQAMAEGAVGISSSLLYAPSMYADTEELIALSSAVSPYGGMYISHIRDEGEYLLESIDELIRISAEANLPAEVYHLKASGAGNWQKMDAAIAKIDSARSAGLKITADIYTYNASSTGLHVQLPDWAREGGVDATIERLTDPEVRARAVAETEFPNPPETILFVGFRNTELRAKYTGKFLPEVAADLGVSPAQAVADLIVADDSRIQVVYFSMSEDNITKKVKVPWVSFCSDAGSYTNEGVFIQRSTHPRAYGSFIRVIGKFARDEKAITLSEGIRKLTSLPAQNLKLKNRGQLAPGYFADIVVFDPDQVRDKATFEDPHQYAEGVQHVFVNGVQVLKDGEHTGATPGRFVKGPGYEATP